MGNRAVIQMSKDGKYNKNNLAIYVHWNGDLDSVKAYLLATKKLMDGRGDFDYCCARLVQVITTFHQGNLSVGLDLSKNLDESNFDNGVYVIDMNSFSITESIHKDFKNKASQKSNEMSEEILRIINSKKS